MSVQVSYPGVYIDEFEPGAPIVGVSTSTGAFIGVASSGDINAPEMITSFDAFKANFGPQPVGGFYLWYAVKGFFDNGGQVCYVVRASNGVAAFGDLTDAKGKSVATVTALTPGLANNGIQVTPTRVNRLQTSLYQPAGNYNVLTARSVQLNAGQGAQFRPGDWVNLANVASRIQIASAAGDILRLASDIGAPLATTGAITLADAPAGTQTFRINGVAQMPAGALVSGAVLTITQNGVPVSGIVETVQTEYLATNPPATTYRVTFREGLNTAISFANPAQVQTEEFTIKVIKGSVTLETQENLSIDPAHPRYYVNLVNDNSAVVQLKLKAPPPTTKLPDSLPSGPATLNQGADENLETIGAQNYLDALDTLQQIDDANLIAIPDAVTLKNSQGNLDSQQMALVHQGVIAHCELLADRFGVLDPEPALPLFKDNDHPRGITDQRPSLDSARGYAALYYPWIQVASATAPGEMIYVPPSGHICGHIAWTDINRGVFKAPAGIEAAVIDAVDVATPMSNIDQGQLNLIGINAIRTFKTGSRPIIWGARTTATTVDSNWQYVNIRRLFIFLEKSIQQGIRWAVFEPNNYSLWQKLKLTISAFLREQWREGALFGQKEEDAFYVRIDDVLNPFTEQQLGRLHIEVGVRPSYPAEFIIVRIGIWDGGQQIEELT